MSSRVLAKSRGGSHAMQGFRFQTRKVRMLKFRMLTPVSAAQLHSQLGRAGVYISNALSH